MTATSHLSERQHNALQTLMDVTVPLFVKLPALKPPANVVFDRVCLNIHFLALGLSGFSLSSNTSFNSDRLWNDSGVTPCLFVVGQGRVGGSTMLSPS